jgi:hypothetical protein
MADSTELSDLTANPSAPDAAAPAPRLPPAPPSIEERMERQQLYQPLSILAVVGLVIAIGYALAVAVGSVIALSKGSPWIMGGWTALFPVLAVLVSAVAWLQIQRSEGTLGGRRLALSGLGIALAVGLGYWAYYLATYLAIRQKADTVAREWMLHICKGEDQAAFWWALDPLARKSRLPADPANDAAFVKDLEVRFNSPEGTIEGGFSQFERGELISILRQSGPDAKIESLGMTDWGYSPEGYQVTLEYRVTAREASFDVTIALRGNEAQHQEYEGRQWFIVYTKSGVRGEPQFTEYGRTMSNLRMQSQAFLESWQSSLRKGEADAAFLDTCDPRERQRLRAPFLEQLAALDAMIFAMSPCNPGPTQLFALGSVNSNINQLLKDTLPGYKEFTQGNLLHADAKRFWIADESKREEVLNDFKALFAQPGPELAASLNVPRSMMPQTREDNGRVEVLHRCSLRLPQKKMYVEGLLYLECDSDSAAEGNLQAWRVARFELLRAKSLPNMPMRGPQPGGGPGGPGMVQPPPRPPAP